MKAIQFLKVRIMGKIYDKIFIQIFILKMKIILLLYLKSNKNKFFLRCFLDNYCIFHFKSINRKKKRNIRVEFKLLVKL